MAKRIAVKDLRAGSVEATPIQKDWSQGYDFEGYGDGEHGWRFWDTAHCDKCKKVLVLSSMCQGERHKDIDNDSRCDGYIGSTEGPMMNYWYPVDNDQIKYDHGDEPERAARLLEHLPVCLVGVDGQYGLALTGGGMDLSWEIVEAYTRIGLLPPVHFCSLPGMADRLQAADSPYGVKSLARDRYLVAACRQSIRVQVNWCKNKLRDLRALETRATVSAGRTKKGKG